MVDLANAVEFIHVEGFVHYDIKLENVLVLADLSSVKLCDFGLSGRAGEVRIGPAEGTPAYMPPELIAVGEGEMFVLNPRADVFALGVLFHAIVFAFL